MSSIYSSIAGSGSSTSVHSVANTVTSTVPLTAAYRPPQKDYAAAFAALQSQYGTTGPGDYSATSGRLIEKKPKKTQADRASSSTSNRDGADASLVSTRRRPVDAHPHAQSTSTAARASPPGPSLPSRETSGGDPSPTDDANKGATGLSKLRKMLTVRKKGKK